MSDTIKFTIVIAFALLCVSFLVGCGRTDALESALRTAGSNREELEKVLEHYTHDPADSLKYRAACFLIENMPGHVSFEPSSIEEYYKAVDHLLLDTRYPLEAHRDSLERMTRKFPGMYAAAVEDIKVITAEYLIHQIDAAFEYWPDNRLLTHITFEQFCEYLLPYKVVDYQPLDYWKDTLKGKYGAAYHDRPWPVQMKYSMVHAANVVNEALRNHVQERSIVSDIYPLLAASNIDRLPFGTCDDYAFLATAVMRSEGIPCFKEDIIWLHKFTGHSWYSVINENGNTMMYKWGLSGGADQTFFYDEPITKVQRHVYARNSKAAEYIAGCRPMMIDPGLFMKDVTSEYVSTSAVPFRIKDRSMKRHGWAYIAVYHYNSWEVVDYARIRNGKAVFNDMGRNVLYLVFGYNGYGLVPAGEPFVLDTDGAIEPLQTDEGGLTTVALSRKYPKDAHTYLVEQRMTGARIEAADKEDFSDAVLMHELSSTDQHRFIEIPDGGEYRYWRYAAPPGSYSDISELEFYLPGSDIPLRNCPVIGTLQVHPALSGNTPDKAFDGDWLTNFSCGLADNAWIGIDLGKPGKIDKIRCIPRSDDNSIHTGDEYELFYWSRGGWTSLGKQSGKTDVLIYDNVPAGSLLLLRNHTRGQEERIFTYENGEQIWR